MARAEHQVSQGTIWRTLFEEQRAMLIAVADMLINCCVSPEQILDRAIIARLLIHGPKQGLRIPRSTVPSKDRLVACCHGQNVQCTFCAEFSVIHAGTPRYFLA
jgi:hypothetical protein